MATRGVTTGLVTTEGLAQAGTIGATTLADAAGILLPHGTGLHGSGGLMDLGPTGPITGRLSADAAALDARIANFDFSAAERNVISGFSTARAGSDFVHVGPIHSSDGGQALGAARGEFGSYDLIVDHHFVQVQNLDGSAQRVNVLNHIDPPEFEVIHFDSNSPAVVRHEYQHILDYRAAASDPTSPNLLRMDWPGAAGSAYRDFAYTELNGFRISAEEISQAYVYAVALGDATAAAEALRIYESVATTYGGIIGTTRDTFQAAMTPGAPVSGRYDGKLYASGLLGTQ